MDAFERARALAPGDPLLLAAIGGLELGPHEFAAALATGHAAIEIDPVLSPAHVVIVDALVELGRNDEARCGPRRPARAWARPGVARPPLLRPRAARRPRGRQGCDGHRPVGYGLARLEIQLFEAAGVAVDLDLALFEASHGDAGRALTLAAAAYDAAPTIRAADALAWALHRLDRSVEARERADEALRLGSVDPLFRYHSGMIWAALREADAARTDLSAALATDPGFSATGAQDARDVLESLGR